MNQSASSSSLTLNNVFDEAYSQIASQLFTFWYQLPTNYQVRERYVLLLWHLVENVAVP